VSGIDTAAADSLKVLDPKRLIREADIDQPSLTDLDFMSTPLNQNQRGRQVISIANPAA
jgi:hypothetical protein